MFDSLTTDELYAILCARIKNTAIGLGAVKGSPCTISSIQKVDDGNIVTFQWTATNGKVKTMQMKVLDGSGSGSGNCDPATCPCIRYTNLTGSGVNVGGIVRGDKFDNVPIQEVIDKLLSAPYTAPAISVALSCNSMYAVEDIPTIPRPIKITAYVTKRTNPITAVKFFVGSTLIHTITTGVTSGGTFTYNYNPLLTTGSTVFKVVAEDGTSSPVATSTVKVLYPSYVGYIHGGTAISNSVVTSLNKVVKDAKAYKYEGILMPSDDTYHIVYAYPKTYGTLTTIKDGMNFEYIQDYEVSEITIDGCNYYVYKLKVPVCITTPGFFQQYS